MDEKSKAECKISCFSNTLIPLGKAPSGTEHGTAARIAHGFNREKENSWHSYLAVPLGTLCKFVLA